MIGASGELASTAFWTRWPTACSRAGGIGHGPQVRVAEQLDLMVAALGGDRVEKDSSGAAAAPTAAARACACGDKPRQQVVHLADRACKRRDHVGAELGIVGMPLGVAREQRQLADQILDVVQDEGEAAVEFLEPLGVRQRLLAMRFGEGAGRLAAGGAQQVEILPVERPAIIGRRQAGRARPADRRGSAERRSRRAALPASIAAAVTGNLPERAQPLRIASKSMIRPLASMRGPEVPNPFTALRPGGCLPDQFHDDAVVIAPEGSVGKKQPARRVEDVGERLDHTLAERRAHRLRWFRPCR